jgi:hypothetical protein
VNVPIAENIRLALSKSAAAVLDDLGAEVVSESLIGGPFGDEELVAQSSNLSVQVIRERMRFFVDVGGPSTSAQRFNIQRLAEFLGETSPIPSNELRRAIPDLLWQLLVVAELAPRLEELFRQDEGLERRLTDLRAFLRQKAEERWGPFGQGQTPTDS